MVRPILEIGNPTLRKENRKVSAPDISTPEVQGMIDDLIETNRSVNGAGLAAPQIGVNVQMFVVEIKDNPRYPYKPEYPLTLVVNPKITPLSDKLMQIYEGCLSVPNLRGVVDRYAEIEIEFFDREGAPEKLIVKGITAGTFQHEYDHLQATLFTDKVKDRATFCSWDSFKQFHEKPFIAYVKEIVDAYGS